MIRKGFTIIEMLSIMTALAVIMLVCAKPVRTLIADIPRTHRDFQTNTRMHHMLKRLQADIEASNSLLEYPADKRISGNLLLIETRHGVICYEFGDDEVIKTVSGDDLPESGRSSESWLLPHAKIHWKVWSRDGKGYAVEVTTSIERRVMGRCEKKLRNSHVYFVGAMGKGQGRI